MAQYALGIGLTIPFEIMERLSQATSAPDVPALAPGLGSSSPADAVHEKVVVGSAPSAEISALASLSITHAALARVVSPAKPEALLLMADERTKHPVWSGFGPLPLVRQMLALAMLSLMLLLGISISDQVNTLNLGSFSHAGGRSPR
jgi:hypothetical protein